MTHFALPLRWKLVLFNAVVVICLLVPLGFVLYRRVEGSYFTNRIRQARENVYWAVQRTEPEGELYVENLGRLAAILASPPSPDYSIVVFDRAGTPVQVVPASGPVTYPGVPYKKVMDTGQEIAVRVPAERAGGPFPLAVYLAPVSGVGGENIGYVQAAVRLDEAQAVLRELRWFLIAGIVAAVAIIIVVSSILTTVSLRLLGRMAQTAESVSRGDISARTPLTGPRDEIWKVGDTFNTMLGQLDHSLTKERAAQVRMRQFLADAAHELRSPLAAVRGFTDVLMRGAKEPVS